MKTIELDQCVACGRMREEGQLESRRVEHHILTLCKDFRDCVTNTP